MGKRVLRQPGVGASSVRAEALTLLPIAVVGIGVLQFAARHEAGWGELLRAGAALVLTQILPGAVLWRAVRPREGWLVEDLAVGAALGAALSIPAQGFSVVLDATPIAWLLGWLVAGAVLVVPAGRKRVMQAAWAPLPWWWGTGVAVGVLLLLSRTTAKFTQAMPGRVRVSTQYVDLNYHQALVGELLHRFPPHSPQVASEPLDYHWFSHAWMAQLAHVSGVDVDLILLRFVPIAGAVLLALVIACAAVRLARHPLAGPVAVTAAVVVGPLGIVDTWFRAPIAAPGSPTVGVASFLAVPLVIVLALHWRGQIGWAALPVTALLALASGGSKGSALPVVIGGVAIVLVVALLRRDAVWRRVALDLGVLVVCLELLVKLLFHGNEGGMRIVPFSSLTTVAGFLVSDSVPTDPSALQVATFTPLLLVIMLAPWFLGLVPVIGRLRVDDLVAWALVGITACGAGAQMVFAHPGKSQTYFKVAADPFTAIALAWGVVLLVGVAPRARHVVGLLVGLLAGVLLVGPAEGLLVEGGRVATSYARLLSFVAWLVVAALVAVGAMRLLTRGRRGVRGSLVTVALCVVLAGMTAAGHRGVLMRALWFGEPPLAMTKPNSAETRSEVLAARYVRDHSAADDVVMTNRHCANLVGRCANRHYWIAAFTERRVLVEGWAYTRRANYGGLGEPGYNPLRSQFWDLELLSLNDGFITAPDAAAQRRLWDMGVRWVYVDKRLPHANDFGRTATEALDNRLVRVLKLKEPTRSG